ncbi:MAG: hypothetical protein HDR72_07105 [Ruminococcaceae bacterium]|nr:hypothetical protein [Oscillospiraceae bacterium]
MIKKTIFMLAALLSLTACNADLTGGSGEAGLDPVSGDGSAENNSDNSDIAGAPESTDSASESAADGESSQTAPESTVREKPNITPNVQGGEIYESGVLVLNNGRALKLYGGGYEEGRNYAENLNQLKNRVGDNVNVFSLVVPTAVSFYLPDKYAEYSGSEWDNIEYINENLDGIIPVDAYTALSRHVDEEIYFRTDIHWQQLGAYYAAEEFAKEALVPFAPLSDFETETIENYVGSMYGMSGENPLVGDNPDVLTYYKPGNKYSVEHFNENLVDGGWYSDEDFDGLFLKSLDGVKYGYWLFLGGDFDAYHIKTDVGNGRKLMLLKDSFGNAFLPCLTGSFEEIWAVDMRGCTKSISQFVKDNGLTDVLFCINSFTATGYEQEYLMNII